MLISKTAVTTPINRKVIRTCVSVLRGTTRRGYEAPEPNATIGIPGCNWSDTVSAKRFHFHPTVHINHADAINLLAFPKTFTSDEFVQNIVNFTNKFAEIVVNDPDAQARVAVNTVVSFISGKTLIKIICGYVLEFA